MTEATLKGSVANRIKRVANVAMCIVIIPLGLIFLLAVPAVEELALRITRALGLKRLSIKIENNLQKFYDSFNDYDDC